MHDSQQHQPMRREMKYIVSESAAKAIREMVMAHISPDKYSLAAGIQGYTLASLYLDAASLKLYRQTRRGEKNRFKLRIRFYDNVPDVPVFLEVKRRETEAILKSRAVVSKQAANRLLAGIRPTAADLVDPSPDSIRDLELFCDLCERIHAKGIVFVSYRREAYMSSDSNRVRVTFDRELVAYRYLPDRGMRICTKPIPAAQNGVILEFKFTDRFPNWMREISQIFELQKRSVPKYVKCIKALRSVENASSFRIHEVA